MSFFDNLFNIREDNYYGVSGLNNELSCIYIYNAFIKYKKGMLVVANSLFEANIIYNKLCNYTDKVLFFPMDDFITSEAIAISPEFKCERLNTLNTLIKDNNYIVVTNLMGVLRYLPKKEIWKQNIIHLEKGMSIERDRLISSLFNVGYERDTIVTETGKLGVRGYVLDVFPIGEENPIRIEFWGDEIDSIKYFNSDSQMTTMDVSSVDIYPYTEFILDSFDNSIDRKQKYLKHYSNEISSLWNYVGNFMCFYIDYNQIGDGYKLLRDSILSYDKENKNSSGIKTDYMYDIGDIKFDNYVFLMNFDNILSNIKLNYEDKFVSNIPEKYNGNIYEIVPEIRNSIEEFSEEKPQSDDITMLVFKYNK